MAGRFFLLLALSQNFKYNSCYMYICFEFMNYIATVCLRFVIKYLIQKLWVVVLLYLCFGIIVWNPLCKIRIITWLVTKLFVCNDVEGERRIRSSQFQNQMLIFLS